MYSSTLRSSGTPRVVVVALSFIGADFVLILFQMLRIDVASTPRFIAVVVTACVLLLWLYGLFRRLNWLRWVTVGLAILGILFLPRVLARIYERGPILFQLFKYALFDTGTVLLCLPAAREWFSSKVAA